MVSPYTISVVTGEDHYCILPKIVLINGINNFSDLLIYFFYQTIIGITVHTPVFGSKTDSRIYIIVVCPFAFNDIGIVRILGEIGRYSRAVPYIRRIDISIREVLAPCVFADIVWIVIRSYQEKRLFMFA